MLKAHLAMQGASTEFFCSTDSACLYRIERRSTHLHVERAASQPYNSRAVVKALTSTQAPETLISQGIHEDRRTLTLGGFFVSESQESRYNHYI
jgi:hypothetical protein